MRLIPFSVMISFALLSSAAVAQQPPEPTAGRSVGDTVGHPPPLPGRTVINDATGTSRFHGSGKRTRAERLHAA
jgi:hypothetical protein